MRRVLCFGLLALGACGQNFTTPDGGADATSDVANPSDAAADSPVKEGGGSDASDGGTEAGCQSGTLHPPPDAGGTIFCPHVDGGANGFCTALTEHCCETSGGVGACDLVATKCGGSDTDWGCQDPAVDCPTNQLCCASAGASFATDDGGCTSVTNFKGASCGASCPGFVLCTSNTECAQGKSCVPFVVNGVPAGLCK